MIYPFIYPILKTSNKTNEFEEKFVLVTMGIILYLFYFYLRLRQQKCHLLQQLHCKQQLTEKIFAEIHNGPMQTLAFLIREVEIHEVPQQELLEYLRDVYHSILVDVENLNDSKN